MAGLDDEFWSAVQRVLAAEDAVAVAEELVGSRPILAEQLQQALRSLDRQALAAALRLTDAGPATEDALLALGCAVVAAGPDVFARARRSPEFLVRRWDLEHGDLLLALSPSASFDDTTPTRGAGPAGINVSLGGSSLGGHRWVNEVLVMRECRRHEGQPRWRAIFEARRFHRLIVHLDSRPGSARSVGQPRSSHDGYLEVDVRWDAPAQIRYVPALVRQVLDAVASKLEGA